MPTPVVEPQEGQNKAPAESCSHPMAELRSREHAIDAIISEDRPAAKLNSDCWYGVQDARKRKQIQDRLAQRQRRKRLGDARHQAQSSAHHSNIRQSGPPLKRKLLPYTDSAEPLSGPSDHVQPDDHAYIVSRHEARSNTNVSSPQAFTISCFARHAFLSTLIPGKTSCFTGFSIYVALVANGDILGIPCISGDKRISKYSPTHPSFLQATALQQSLLHPSLIDRFPFPRFRDKVILLTTPLDEAHIMWDMFTMPGFKLMPGKSWEPSCWQMTSGFKAKWGYLFV